MSLFQVCCYLVQNGDEYFDVFNVPDYSIKEFKEYIKYKWEDKLYGIPIKKLKAYNFKLGQPEIDHDTKSFRRHGKLLKDKNFLSKLAAKRSDGLVVMVVETKFNSTIPLYSRIPIVGKKTIYSGEQLTCAICLLEDTWPNLITTNCKTCFHSACLQKCTLNYCPSCSTYGCKVMELCIDQHNCNSNTNVWIVVDK